MASCILRSALNINRLARYSLNRFVWPVSVGTINVHTSFIPWASTVIKMPALSPTMTEGTIVKWLKKEGETVQPGDALCEIQTDKAVITMEVEDEGILAKILLPDDSKDIKIGIPIAVMVEEGDDWKNVEVPTSTAAPPSLPAASKAPSASTSLPTSGSGPAGIVIKMPSLSPTMTEGTIVKWNLKEGDTFQPGDVLCEIQTDKAVVAMETDEEGILAKILLPDDTKNVQIGQPIALMVEPGVDWKAVQMPSDVGAPPPSAAATQTPETVVATPPSAHSQIAAGPAVRNLLLQYNLTADAIKATGPHGKLIKGDVLKYIETNQLKPVPTSAIESSTVVTKDKVSKPSAPARAAGAKYTDIPLTNMRRTIAKRLTESKTTIPHAYAVVDCFVDAVQHLREKMKGEGKKVSVNDFVVKAAAVALQRVPDVNAIWTGQGAKLLADIDISVAVATDDGLITPIVKNAIGLPVEDISNKIRELAGKARSGKLKPEEFMGGTFTISNLGMFGITSFSAIINPPQAAILAVGTSRKVFEAAGDIEDFEPDKVFSTKRGKLEPFSRMTATLCYDSRVVDEDAAARFLQAFRDFLEVPSNLTVGLPRSRVSSV